MDRVLRRHIRKAVHNQDISKLKQLTRDASTVNYILSDRIHDTILSYCIRHGYLECVEYLVSRPECRLDSLDRNRHSLLDIAICEWVKIAYSPVTEPKSAYARRYRILKCLLSAGARLLSLIYTDLQLFSTLTCDTGPQVVFKLAKVVGIYGHVSVKNSIFSYICSYPSTHSSLTTLLHSGVNPTAYLTRPTHKAHMALDTAILLVKASNNDTLLAKIECDTSFNMKDVGSTQNWPMYKALLICFTISGHKLQLHVMDYLYHNHAHVYLGVCRYHQKPRQLTHLCRQAVRTRLLPNTIVGIKALQILPETVKRYLLFE